jgi:hypothetical protein
MMDLGIFISLGMSIIKNTKKRNDGGGGGIPSMQLFSRNITSRKFSLHIKYVMELGWNGVCHSSFGSSLSYFQYT